MLTEAKCKTPAVHLAMATLATVKRAAQRGG